MPDPQYTDAQLSDGTVLRFQGQLNPDQVKQKVADYRAKTTPPDPIKTGAGMEHPTDPTIQNMGEQMHGAVSLMGRPVASLAAEKRANDVWATRPSFRPTLSPKINPKQVENLPGGMENPDVQLAQKMPQIAGSLALMTPAVIENLPTVARSIAGGAAGGYLASKGAEAFGASPENQDTAGDIGSIVGGLGGAYQPELGTAAASKLRYPATPTQALRGQAGTPKNILPSMMQHWTIPDWAIPKGSEGTAVNPGLDPGLIDALAKAKVQAAVSKGMTNLNPIDPYAPGFSSVEGVAPGNRTSIIPEPRPQFEGENPKYMASVKRQKLQGLATGRKPGAGTQLQQLGETVLYAPGEGTGYEGPRSMKIFDPYSPTK